MTTSINIRFNGESNMGLIHRDVTQLRAEFKLLQEQAIKAAATSPGGLVRGMDAMKTKMGEVRHAYGTATAAAGEYQLLQQKLVPQSVSFAEAIKQQKVGLADAWKNRSLMNKVLREQIALQHSASLAWSKDSTGKISSDLIVPKSVPANLITARQQMGLYNKLLGSVSANTINWGKNTQWAGRQLMTGLTLPISIVAGLTAKLAYDMDKSLAQVVKVYGDVTTGIVENTDVLKKNAMNTVKATSAIYGQSAKDTLAIMADLAAAGKTGNDLQQMTMMASKASVLGELEWQTAASATITLQNVYHHNARQIGDDFNYINAMENQTVLTSQDFTTAIPKISGVMNTLGGDLKDVGTLLAAFKGAGIEAAEGANALKTINFRLVATYGKGLKTFQAATGQSLTEIVESTGGKTIPTLLKFADAIKGLSAPKKVQVVRDVFGIYQGSKALLLLEQLTGQTDQLSQAMAVGNNSVAENAAIASAELNRLSETPFMKIQKAVARMNVTLSEVGATVLPLLAGIIEKVGSAIQSFQGISPARKNITLFILAAVAAAGPVIMLIGLFSNLLGNIGKVVASLGNLALRFKITDAAERSRQLNAKASVQMWDLKTAAIARQTIALEKLIAEMQAAALAVNPGLAPLSTAAIRAGKAAPTPIPMPTDPTADGRYRRLDNGRLQISKGYPGGGNFIKEHIALDLEKARTVEMNKQIQAADLLERKAAERIVLQEKGAATDAHLNKVAAERLAIETQTALVKKEQMIANVRMASGTIMMGGMIASMAAGSETLVGKLGNAAMMLGMVSMMFPKRLAMIATLFTTQAKAFGAMTSLGMAKIGMPVSSASSAIKGFGTALKGLVPVFATVAVAAGIYWKIVHDAAEKSRKEMEDYGKTVQTVADIMQFSYQESPVFEQGGPAKQDETVKDQVEKFKKANPAAERLLVDEFSGDSPKKIGEQWGEAIRQGAAARLHGASTQVAEDTAFMILKVMGSKISASEFTTKIKAEIDFGDLRQVIDTQAAGIVNDIERAVNDMGSGMDKWNRDWNPLAGITSAEGGDIFGTGQDDLTVAAEQAAKDAGKKFYSAWNATEESLKPKFLETAVNTINVPMNVAFEKFPEQMRKHGIAGGAALSKELSKLDLAGKKDLLKDIGFNSDQTDEIIRTSEALKAMSKELAVAMGFKTEQVATVIRPEDVIALRKAKDATDEYGVAYISVREAATAYKVTLDAAAKAGYKVSDAEKLALLNMQRLRVYGLKPTNNLMDEFGEVTISAAEAAEELSNKLKTGAGILEEYGFNLDLEHAQSAIKGLRDSVIEDVSSKVTNVIADEAKNEIDSVTASGKAAVDALDARIKAADNKADEADEKLKKRQDDAKKRLDKDHDKAKKAMEDAFDARMQRIKDAIDAEKKAEDIRQKIFEAEKSRIQRLAEMYNKNVDLNMAINSGSMDEAAKIQNDMIATQQGWDVEDAGGASKTNSEKKIEALEKQLENIGKAKTAQLDALDAVQKAEKDALDAKQERDKKALQDTRDNAKGRFDAEKKALDDLNAANLAAVNKRWETRKAGFERELETLRSMVPRNEAEMKAQIAGIQALYKKYGDGTLIPQGKAWGKIVEDSMVVMTKRSGERIKGEVPWDTIGAEISAGIMKGAFGMTAKEFTLWLNGGVAPAGSPFAPPASPRGRPDQGHKDDPSRHDGGMIRRGDRGSTTGYSRQSGLAPSEMMIRALEGEGVVSRKGMANLGPKGLNALNSGLPIGGPDLTGGFGIAGVPMAMIAGAAKGIIKASLMAIGKKRQDADLGLEFSGLGEGTGNAQKVYNTLTSLGFTPQAAAGVIGNLMQESGVNPGSQQQGGPGRGIMQWSEGERFASLKSWAGKKDPWALDTQVQYMLKEMNDYGLTNRFKGMKDINAATLLFEEVMERAGIPNMAARYRHANNAFKQFGSGTAPGGAAAGMFGQNIVLPGGATVEGPAHTRLINFGRELQKRGFNVGEHPAFGRVYPVHAPNSWHYKDGAIDVNFDGQGQGYEDSKINSILAMAKKYGLRTIWQYPGHYNHAHFDIGTGADLGNFGTGGDDLSVLGQMAGMGRSPVEDIMARGGIGQKILPVRGPVSSRFGLRNNPLLGRDTFHDGTDIVAPLGTPIHSLAGGRVLFAGMDKAYGNYTVVQHSNGMLSAYGHQSKMNVGAGDVVRAGQIIGNVGSTGASTGPHLHFQTGTANKWFNPNTVMPQLKTGGFTLNDGYARLHKAETVLTAPLSTKLNEGIDRFANGPVTTYTIKADFNGATFATDVDVERAFQSLMDKAEHRNGSNRRVGSR